MLRSLVLLVLAALFSVFALAAQPPYIGTFPSPEWPAVPEWQTANEGEWASDYGEDTHINAIYFTYLDKLRGYVFGISAVQNGDVYFHMAGPITSSWIGIGFGSQMAGSYMIVAYPSADGLNTTISVRHGTGHTEPAYVPGIEIEHIWTDAYAPSANTVSNNGTGGINAHSVCRNCAQYGLDFDNPEQDFFWALGPNKTLRSDALDASISLHAYHGRFTGDMTQAVNRTGNYTRIPGPNVPDYTWPPSDAAFASFATSPPFDVVTSQDDHSPAIHGFMMSLTFLIIFPFGTLVKLILRKVIWHAAIQGIGTILVIVAFGISVKVSALYIKSKDFNSGHQILGLIILAGVIVQAGLGLIHHAIFARTKGRTPLGRFHILLGPLVMILGIINGGLGWRFAGNWKYDAPYTIVAIVITVFFFGLLGCILLLRQRRRAYKAEVDYEGPKFGHVASPSSSSSSANGGAGKYNDNVVVEHKPVPIPMSYGAEPPTPYEPHTPMPLQPLPYEPPAPYAHNVPYTPLTAYMPESARTFKKAGVTEYAMQGREE